MRFVRLLEAAADQGAGGVKLGMLAEDQKAYRFTVASECAAILVAALTAEMGKLGNPSGDEQFIVVKGVTTALSDQGAPMLILTLESGGELPLAFGAGDLNELIGELQGLTKAIAPGQPH